MPIVTTIRAARPLSSLRGSLLDSSKANFDANNIVWGNLGANNIVWGNRSSEGNGNGKAGK